MANPAQNKDRVAVKSGLDDLLGNVIRNDRQRAGRGEPSAPTEPPAQPVHSPTATPDLSAAAQVVPSGESTPSVVSPVSSSETRGSSEAHSPETGRSDIMTDTHYDTMTNGQTEEVLSAGTPQTSRAESAPVRRKSRLAVSPPATPAGGLASARVKAAENLATTPTMTLTLRIPQGLNEWLDGYVHGSWPQKIRKQELVIEALKLLYARRGNPGEEFVTTALLGEEEDA